MAAFTGRAAPSIEALGHTVLGPAGSSVCERQVQIGPTPGATIDTLEAELRWLQQLAPLIDATIKEVETAAN